MDSADWNPHRRSNESRAVGLGEKISLDKHSFNGIIKRPSKNATKVDPLKKRDANIADKERIKILLKQLDFATKEHSRMEELRSQLKKRAMELNKELAKTRNQLVSVSSERDSLMDEVVESRRH